MDVRTLGVGQMRARGILDGPGLTAPVWAQQLCAQGSLGLLLCMSGPVINDPQTLLFTPSPPLEAAAATAHLANGHTRARMDAHEGRGVICDQMHVKWKQFASHKRALFQAVSNFGAMIRLISVSLCSIEAERTPVSVCRFPACQAAVGEWFMTTGLQPVFTASSVLLQLTANEARHAFKQGT